MFRSTGALPHRSSVLRSLSAVLLQGVFALALCGCAALSGAEAAPAPTATPAPASEAAAAPSSRNKELYRDFFGSFYGWDNENTQSIYVDHTNLFNVYLADLTHDGEDEMIVIDDSFGDGVELTVYSVIDGSVEMIGCDRSTYEPRDRTFGLYEKDGQTYLFVAANNMTQEGGDCSYRVFHYTPDGQQEMLIQDRYAERINPETEEISEEYNDFLLRQEQALQQTQNLFRCEDGFLLQSSPADVLN